MPTFGSSIWSRESSRTVLWLLRSCPQRTHPNTRVRIPKLPMTEVNEHRVGRVLNHLLRLHCFNFLLYYWGG